MGFEVDGNLKNLRDAIITEWSSVPQDLQRRFAFNPISVLASMDYTSPFALQQLGTIFSSLVNQKNTLTSNNEFVENAHERRVQAEEKWEEQKNKCYQLSMRLGSIDKDKNPDEYAAVQKDLYEAEWWRDLRGEQMVDAVKFDNNISFLV